MTQSTVSSFKKSTAPLVDVLKDVLADHYALYIKTQNYHWNVQGENFKTLHSLFGEQYNDLATAIDTTAELIRGLNEKVPATFKTYADQTTIEDGDHDADYEQMVQDLLDDHVILSKTLQNALEISQKQGDEVVANFFVERLTVLRKAAWMLRSSLN